MTTKETYDIPNVEIFGVGDWKGFHFDESTVERMVADTNSLAGRAPYARIKHESEYDEDVRAKFGDPRFATLRNLRVNAGKVIADLVGVPGKIYQAIMRGILPSRSVELTRGYDGHPFVIDCVSFGGGHPEVKTLAGMGILEAGEQEGKYERVVIDYPPNLEEIMRMEEEPKAVVTPPAETPPDTPPAIVADEKADALQAIAAERDALKAELDALKAEKAGDSEKIAALEKRINEMGVDSQLDKLVHSGKLTPAERDTEKVHLMELRGLPNKVRFGEKDVTLYERRIAELDGREPKVKFGERAPEGSPDSKPEPTDAELKKRGLSRAQWDKVKGLL